MSEIKNEIPAGLSRESRRIWLRLCELYDFSDPAARLILRTALQARDRVEEARKAIKADGITTKNRFGVAIAHPALQIEASARRQMLHAFRELGLDGGAI
jgi:P27 family predicted phage terminase small subunit